MKKIIISLSLIIISRSLCIAEIDQKLFKYNNISIQIERNIDGSIRLSSFFKKTKFIDVSKLGIITCDKKFCFEDSLEISSIEDSIINEKYFLPTGKQSCYNNNGLQRSFTIKNSYGNVMKLVVRLYDNGLAFKYKLENASMLKIKEETTQFNIPENATTWMMDWIKHNENFFIERRIDQLKTSEFLYPALIYSGNVWVLLTESDVYDKPATYLKLCNKQTFKVNYAKEDSLGFYAPMFFESSWKAFVVSDKIKNIVESTLVENLNPKSTTNDFSWIKGGVVTFPWWGNYMANSYIEVLKEYVDLASEMQWEWIEFDVALVNSPLRTAKYWETTSWIKEFCEYAKSKNIKVYGWDEISKLDTKEKRDYIFSKYKELGIDGIKVDYINSDSQYAMKFRDSSAADALKYKLLISYHGETTPRGQRRRYPNIMTHEGVKGAEWYTFKGYAPPNPTHNCTLPFTRNVVGPMDYTPCTFTVRNENPRQTTYAHELALPFIFESGWVCMPDKPQMYLNSPAKDLLKRIEATWDETVFLDGYPGEYVCLARRKGNTWFISAINASQKRSLKIDLSFIPSSIKNVVIYKDNIKDPINNISIENIKINKNRTLELYLLPNGGAITIIDF